MPGKTNIEWTDRSWNPTTGCTQVSPGCAHCYAKTLTERFNGKGSFDEIVLHPERLDAPLHWKKPSRVFVNSMSDLFHEDIPDEFIDKVFAVMALTPQHTYQCLSKRPERMHEYMTRPFPDVIEEQIDRIAGEHEWCSPPFQWPLQNVWLGVTVENQRWADERIPILLDTPAAIRFVSAEPLLGPVNLQRYLPEVCEECDGAGHHHVRSYAELDAAEAEGIILEAEVDDCDALPCDCCDGRGSHELIGGNLDWVIVGGESGPRHRPFNPEWARSIVAQCQEAGIAPFVKQLGGMRPGNRLEDLPEDLRVREWPGDSRQ